MEAEFRSMLITLGEKMKEGDLDKFMYYAQVKAKPRQNITLPIHFFTHLEEREQLSPENINYLLQILRHCVPERNDLITIVNKYQNNSMSREATIDAVPEKSPYKGLQDVKLFLSKNLGKNWRFVMRYLGVSDEEIDFVEEKYSRNLCEQINKTFQIWLDNEREKATLDRVKKALRKEDRNDLITKIEKGNF